MAAVIQFRVPKVSVACFPWHARAAQAGAVKPGTCKFCSREIAIPVDADVGFCIPCGMDRGIIPPVDVELQF